MEHGADCNLASFDGVNPIMHAAMYNNIHALELLLRQDSINVNCLMTDILSPLTVACMHVRAEFVSMLLMSGKCDLMLKAANLQTAWSATISTEIASQRDQFDIVRLLLATGKMDINSFGEGGQRSTAVHDSAWNNKIQQVNLLLAHPDIDTKLKREEGLTALMLAVTFKQRQKANKLPWDEESQISLVIINMLIERKTQHDRPNWVSPLADPCFKRDPSTWCPEEGRGTTPNPNRLGRGTTSFDLSASTGNEIGKG
jgi:ankyrin repeat protein